MSLRERLGDARLYLVCDARSQTFLAAALAGGVDVIQLRDKALDDAGIVAAARPFRAAADAHDALFILNDRPDLVDACDADGVHVGQDDGSPAEARAVVGPERIVGRSTHAPEQADAALADPDVDYFAAGPVHATPTKPGRPAAGLGYVGYAARAGAGRTANGVSRSAATDLVRPDFAGARPLDDVTKPWFAIGGLDVTTIGPVLDAGARRIVVVRAITDAPDPQAAARVLRAALEEAPDGAT